MELRVAREKSENQADQCHYRFIIVNLMHNQHYLAMLDISLVSSLSHSLEMIFQTISISFFSLFFFFLWRCQGSNPGPHTISISNVSCIHFKPVICLILYYKHRSYPKGIPLSLYLPNLRIYLYLGLISYTFHLL